jgi:hypothetical protein
VKTGVQSFDISKKRLDSNIRQNDRKGTTRSFTDSSMKKKFAVSGVNIATKHWDVHKKGRGFKPERGQGLGEL